MSRTDKNDRYVIFAGPQQFKAPGTRYIAKDGSVTNIRSEAAKFSSYYSAQEFAEQNNIELTVLRYIGIETFTKFELDMD